jgi:hypothetical protein
MTPEQIREIVKITIEELTASKLLKVNEVNYEGILNYVEEKINSFFHLNINTKSVTYALNQLSDDQYIDIIFLQYRDNRTLEWIAEYMDKDVRTILRNKKRLIIKMYELMEE